MKPHSQLQTSGPRSIVLGTAGHIDHGKTSLVRALTGTDTDTLPQERERGITIDLGFAALQLAAPDGTPVQVSIVDVPGHHAFIRNMVAGVAGIDCVLLVVAANEGVKPQTLEHLQICEALGIRHGLIVLTKADSVAAETLARTQEQTRATVARTFLARSPVLVVSAHTGAGMAELKAAIATLARTIPAPAADSVLRLPIDRAFTVRGAGTVVTGTLQAGTLRANDTLELQPEARTVRVRGIQVHKASATEARGPARVALNLAREDVADFRRGRMLVAPETVAATWTVDVELYPVAGHTLPRHRSRVRVHALAAETTATLLHYQDLSLKPEGSALARLSLREPLVLLPGDRFILRQLSPAATVAGGLVVDASPRRRLRKAQTLSWLQNLSKLSREDAVLARIERAARDVTLRDLIAETGLNQQTLLAALQPAAQTGSILVQWKEGSATRCVAAKTVDAATGTLLAHLMRSPRKELARAELQSASHLGAWLFSLAWKQLLKQPQAEATGDRICIGQTPSPMPSDQLLVRLEKLYRNAGLASPITSEAALTLGTTGTALFPLVTQLIRRGLLQRMGADNLLIHTDALHSLELQLRQHRGEQFDVARFKQLTGLSRKHAIPLLEYLDGRRIFRNVNGLRTVL